MNIRNQLEAIRNVLYESLNDMINEIATLPEGELYIYERNGVKHYCQRFKKIGNRKKERRYSISNDTDTILALVRKKYLETAIKHVINNQKIIDHALSKYKDSDAESIMSAFFEKYPNLRNGVNYGKVNPEEWMDSYSQEKLFYEDDLKSTSLRGDRMRSAGEMYIESRLDHFKIPYRYEAPLKIPDLNYAPDFTILRPRDGKIFYWEHFGKINDDTYVRKNYVKVGDYIDYGIRPWDNLIMTFNNEKGGFNGKLIDAMIECHLL